MQQWLQPYTARQHNNYNKHQDTFTTWISNHTKTKWATFTYVGPQTKHITKLFKNTNLQIAYKTNNTIQKLFTRTNTSTADKFDNCEIYQLTYLDCNKQYVGQTGRFFLEGTTSTLEILNTIMETLNMHSTSLKMGILSAL